MNNKNLCKISEIVEAMRKKKNQQTTFITRRNLIFLGIFFKHSKRRNCMVSVAIDYECVRKIQKKHEGTAEKLNAFLVSLVIAEALKKAHFQNTFMKKV